MFLPVSEISQAYSMAPYHFSTGQCSNLTVGYSLNRSLDPNQDPFPIHNPSTVTNFKVRSQQAIPRRDPMSDKTFDQQLPDYRQNP